MTYEGLIVKITLIFCFNCLFFSPYILQAQKPECPYRGQTLNINKLNPLLELHRKWVTEGRKQKSEAINLCNATINSRL